VLELFICETEIKIYFERWLFHVNDWQWGLAIFHNKQVRAVLSSLKFRVDGTVLNGARKLVGV
jgi:hypothetical protein